ncbi:YjjW family glycine radical enzyme activase [Massilicoli timonensis]|uniref:YjjW family glycine radical enzyme activase n=1 Tax=Massilicoli timonensis TaxID=2015901 RepID=UPI0023F4A0CE|nr:YjjW family glycine radical enzyme activase [Massilicoli timonensis]
MPMHWIVAFMMKAPVNNIIDFSNVDGPGNRCAIFFQSCPFSCLYCHNPETIRMCVHCGKCVATCPTQALRMEAGKVVFEASRCVKCDTCIRVCEHQASPRIQMMSVADLCEHISKLKPFIRGITVSGGECMNQAAFLLDLFQEVKKMGLTCLIDSNGAHDFSKYPQLLALCDGVMLDVKAVDPHFHQKLCGADNAMVLRNLDYLLENGKLQEVRTVLLPNEKEQNRKTVSYVSVRIKDRSQYKLIRYRPYGVREAGLKAFGNQTLAMEEVAELVEICEKNQNHLCRIA